ncbi:hypothetical protein AJ80_03277 [Polytolypa hystricis UAMH7299]|uniref:HNH nuclease domain-containing protein n=1 Tax=Polytolypa hystricis (strain UAMH7299) TaxID=1447883 RepID=A0A2B7YJL0_POLH7|nr:hypothetical protein AJ80_03277 [Polytolypa hystricis UAMH7299]
MVTPTKLYVSPKQRLERINESSNLFTAADTVHNSFGRFNLALKPMPGQNKYRVKYWEAVGAILPFLEQYPEIQFIDQSGANTPIPDPDLFRTHYVIAQILHATGLGRALDEFFEEYSYLRCLASDGSTTLPFLIEAG